MQIAKPKSHGNYVESLTIAEKIIQDDLKLFDDLDADDLPMFALVFISDGKPSDKLPFDKMMREEIMIRLANLKSKLSFLGMGIGSSGSDFIEMEQLANNVTQNGRDNTAGTFIHAGLNPASISTCLSSVATSMTTTRNDLLSAAERNTPKTEKIYTMRNKNDKKCQVQIRRQTHGVKRFRYDPTYHWDYPWREIEFINADASGFEVEKDPFGKGAERLAHIFYEIKRHPQAGWERVGKAMVAKESRYHIRDEGSKVEFHTSFCKVQLKAQEFAKQFNDAVKKAPSLKPSEDEVSLPPPIVFLKCDIYEYLDTNWEQCGLLVEKYLNGKFTKYNGNNGYVIKDTEVDGTVNLTIGEVKLTDFLQAFSHWVYERSSNKMLVCDLQGILDLEGRRPVFRLTDPVICSKGKSCTRYGKTDIGMAGIRQFCRHHKCNNVCKGLNLPLMRAR